ncbi:hypothetical protein SEVIR_5G225800v4 [Setaria viridis]|nr:uncharacterized protein LOC101777463 [Setaria italica]XP_034592738.1 uncharacterized protein LOC117854619 [Setaria viridis]RCV26109.1 hypothetical protein SETIT_5G219000v2 [Setaria italica]TKW15260.1 hypothetical protein SEVIR_5G225800v2 [Setaria viridis]
MATGLLSKVSIAVAAYARRFTRRLLRARRLRRGGSACLGRQLVPADGGCGGDRQDGGQEQGALWRRAILMGRRCEPLDFPGAIHYDSFGRRLESPRCGSRKASGALFCRSSDAVDEAVVTAVRKAS